MHAAGEVFWTFESALDERFVDDDFRGDVRQFTSTSKNDFECFWQHRRRELERIQWKVWTRSDAGQETENHVSGSKQTNWSCSARTLGEMESG